MLKLNGGQMRNISIIDDMPASDQLLNGCLDVNGIPNDYGIRYQIGKVLTTDIVGEYCKLHKMP